MSLSFSLFLPMYNVSGQVVDVLRRIPEDTLSRINQVLLIDNGSTDGTVDIVADYLRARGDRKFRLFRNQRNYFLGGSTIIALKESIAAGSDFMICLHSDGQADPAEVRNFMAKAHKGVDFVFGSRLEEGAGTGEYSLVRLWGNKFFSWLQRRITGQPINDIGAYIAFNLETIGALPYWRVPHDMAYQPLLVLLACGQKKIRFEEFPIHWGKVEASNVNALSYGLVHLKRLLAISFGFFPLWDKEPAHFKSDEIKWAK